MVQVLDGQCQLLSWLDIAEMWMTPLDGDGMRTHSIPFLHALALQPVGLHDSVQVWSDQKPPDESLTEPELEHCSTASTNKHAAHQAAGLVQHLPVRHGAGAENRRAVALPQEAGLVAAARLHPPVQRIVAAAVREITPDIV